MLHNSYFFCIFSIIQTVPEASKKSPAPENCSRIIFNHHRGLLMKKIIVLLCILSPLCLLLTGWKAPDEGMWLLNALDKLPLGEMKKHGLELSLDQIYTPHGTSLKDAIVLLGGGTCTFVSNDGLILTNHHVAYEGIQTVTSVQEDYLKDGFYAKTKEEEISLPVYTARIVVSMKDVTNDILSAVNDSMSADARAKAIQAKSREVEKTEKGTTDYECRVSELFNGVKYILYTYEALRDVRLVYAPPSAIGNYGGEVDNWYWPRHTGDFAFMRAYVGPDGKPAKYSKENVPYHPKTFLPISMKGYEEGSFAMIMGFPGRTFRYRTSPEIQLAKDETLPLTINVYKQRMDIMEAAGKKDRAVEIKFANRWRGLANGYKNYQGTLEGMRRSDLLKLRQDEESKFRQFLSSKPELNAKYGTVLSDISKTYDDLKSFNQQQIVMGQFFSGIDVLRTAAQFKEYANSFIKDSTGAVRAPEKNTNDLKEFIGTVFKIVDVSVDKEIMTVLIQKAAELPVNQEIEAIRNIVGNKTGEDRDRAVKKFVDELYSDTKLTTPDGCNKLMMKSADDIRDDKFVKFAIDLDKTNIPLQARTAKFNAQIGLQRRTLMEAMMAWMGPDIYPDANRTLRFTFGQVKSYNPRDAVHYNYESTLGGVMEKETGEDPFIVPPKLRELWEKKDFGPYADKSLGDVPVAFLADLDITGGNSGSAVINGKGEVIGLAFDGNWESVVGDYVFQEPLNRTISVDARYVLFVLDKFSNAQNILNELKIQ